MSSDYPKLQSAGLQGAKALGKAQLAFNRATETDYLSKMAERLAEMAQDMKWGSDRKTCAEAATAIASLREERDIAVAALKTLRHESCWLAKQLAAHGQPGSEGDCVGQAFAKADAAISVVDR